MFNVWSTIAIALALSAPLLNAQFAYVVNSSGNNVSGYTINPATGALVAIAGSPFNAGTFPQSVAVDPNNRFVYVANSSNNNVSAYMINPVTGALTGIAGSPFPAGSDPLSVAVDSTGKFVYVANNVSNNVSAYTINSTTGALTAVAGSPFTTEATVFPDSGRPFTVGELPLVVAVDPTGKFAYVTNVGDSYNISGYTINPTTGALTPIVGSPFNTGFAPESVAFEPSGKFAYVSNSDLVTVSGYTINSTTGALTAIAGSPFATATGSFPKSVAVDPSGKFFYVTNIGDQRIGTLSTISGYTINPTTGALAAIAGSPFATGSFPESVAVDPSGKFAYVVNEGDGTVSVYGIGSTGALTPVPGSPFLAGNFPAAVAITPLVPFASSFAKLEITAGPPPGFDLKESFTLATNSNGINPLAENVTLQIGPFSTTIPPGSFKQRIRYGRFAFEGVINGVTLEVQIVPLGNNIFRFNAEGKGVDLNGLTNPVTVVLTVGNDTGSTTATAHSSKQH